MTYEGSHVFNPGRFIGRSLGFSTYTPASRESEAWCVNIYISFSYCYSCRIDADRRAFFLICLLALWIWKPRVELATRHLAFVF
jgi:hypothetical protein